MAFCFGGFFFFFLCIRFELRVSETANRPPNLTRLQTAGDPGGDHGPLEPEGRRHVALAPFQTPWLPRSSAWVPQTKVGYPRAPSIPASPPPGWQEG